MSDLIRTGLREPKTSIGYSLGRALNAEFPDRGVLEIDGCNFGVESFAFHGNCGLRVKPGTHSQMVHSYCGPDEDEESGFTVSGVNAWFLVSWEGHELEVVQASWESGYRTAKVGWIIAANVDLARAFYTRVCEWSSQVRGEILVYESGGWSKSSQLFRSIKTATFDNLVLRGELKQEIRNDLTRFAQARSTYEGYKIPWKRGVLLVGPPGNGKTHTVKALINELQVPCLYVKSFKAQYQTDHECIREVFRRARKTTPCVLVMEDLDSLIDGGNRSFFLNELDGFSANTGIITLATTNHPDRLDRSILERPSRFDRKYHFELPEAPERLTYARLWNASIQEPMRVSEENLQRLIEQTGGFSFAYLKELFLSATMQWIDNPVQGNMDNVILAQVPLLREQMLSSPEDPPMEDAAVSPRKRAN